jgi:HAE1 family hydrophobic/amphiphilic exporter-1
MKYLTGKPELAGGLTDLASDLGSPTRVYRFKVLSEKAAEYKLKPAQVVGLAGSVVNGQNVGKFRLQDEDVDLKLMIAPESLRVPEDVLQVPVVDFPAGPLKIGDLCRLVTYLEPSTLHRYQGARAVTITANLHSKARMSITSLVREVKDFHRRVAALYPGANLVFAGEYESTRKSYTSLFYAFLIAMGVMYLILATQFRSYLQPLIILTSVAFALIGVVFGKLVTQTIFTINSFIATVGVAGVVVNDALVLIDFINKRYRTGLSRREAVVQATHMRLRPILLTTLTTSLGLLPMAVGFPEYSLVWGTMASTFVTGLCTATGLTIVAVPVLWEMVEKIRERCGGGVLRDTPLGTELEGF